MIDNKYPFSKSSSCSDIKQLLDENEINNYDIEKGDVKTNESTEQKQFEQSQVNIYNKLIIIMIKNIKRNCCILLISFLIVGVILLALF
jgi:hypothetical protein